MRGPYRTGAESFGFGKGRGCIPHHRQALAFRSGGQFPGFFLPPWHENFQKRLIKSPKPYFYDVGLTGYLAGITEEKQWETHPLRGPFFETMVVGDLVKKSFPAPRRSDWFFLVKSRRAGG